MSMASCFNGATKLHKQCAMWQECIFLVHIVAFYFTE